MKYLYSLESKLVFFASYNNVEIVPVSNLKMAGKQHNDNIMGSNAYQQIGTTSYINLSTVPPYHSTQSLVRMQLCKASTNVINHSSAPLPITQDTAGNFAVNLTPVKMLSRSSRIYTHAQQLISPGQSNHNKAH